MRSKTKRLNGNKGVALFVQNEKGEAIFGRSDLSGYDLW
jgi:hypothetical protein